MQTLLTVVGRVDAVTLLGEQLGKHRAQFAVVLDHQHAAPGFDIGMDT